MLWVLGKPGAPHKALAAPLAQASARPGKTGAPGFLPRWFSPRDTWLWSCGDSWALGNGGWSLWGVSRPLGS